MELLRACSSLAAAQGSSDHNICHKEILHEHTYIRRTVTMAEARADDAPDAPVEVAVNTDHEGSAPAHQHQLAPWLPIPSRAISAVEHPCIVKNVDKGITSLGGPVKLSKVTKSCAPAATHR